MASINIERGNEDVFNDFYDTEHVPYLSQVPGSAVYRPVPDR